MAVNDAKRPTGESPQPDRSTRRLTVGLVAGIAVLLLAAFVQTPWVPLERIETTHGPIAGYVLSVDPGYLNVLTDGRKFVRLNRNDVRSRHRAARSRW